MPTIKEISDKILESLQLPDEVKLKLTEMLANQININEELTSEELTMSLNGFLANQVNVPRNTNIDEELTKKSDET